jgi:enoyl-[acyl-carrier protein] reductase III
MKDKYAIILGGSSGLGLATAHKLSISGFNICIVHRDRKNNLPFFYSEIEKMKNRGVKVVTINKDALSSTTITEVCNNIPKQNVVVLIHSIAKGSLKPLYSEKNKTLTKQDFDITIHAMATSWLEWTQALIMNNLFAPNSRNIAFTSEGNTKVWEGYGAVSAAKVTLESLMRFMAVEYAPLGMTSNCIQAGMTQTPSFSLIPNSEKLAVVGKKRNPFQRLTTPEDVANAVYLLTQPEANWINGTILKVDGGESLR